MNSRLQLLVGFVSGLPMLHFTERQTATGDSYGEVMVRIARDAKLNKRTEPPTPQPEARFGLNCSGHTSLRIGSLTLLLLPAWIWA